MIIATMDRKKILADCLERYALQTHQDLEIVVVDNGSTDGTVEHIRALFPDVIIERFDSNVGPEALNRAVDLASGDLLWRTDDDAYPADADTIADAVAFMNENPDVAVITGEVIEATIGFKPLDYYPFDKPEVIPPEGLYMNEFCGAAAMIRRDAFIDAGGFWDVFYSEELDLSSKIILNGGHIRYVPWVQVIHLSAFTGKRDMVGRWLKQAEQSARYQWKYFGVLRAIGRSFVIWLGLSISAVGHRMSPLTYLKGMKALYVGKKKGRAERRSLTRRQMAAITAGRSVWDTVFRYYKIRWKMRGQSK